MKKSIILSLAMILLCVSPLLAESEKHSYKPENGYVSDATTAIKIKVNLVKMARKIDIPYL